MKLQWLRAGCASIAEYCGKTCLVCWNKEAGVAQLVIRGVLHELLYSSDYAQGTSTAEAACEAWLDQHDKPVWHDCGEGGWLSWAEWRGECLMIRKVSDNDWKFNRVGATYNDGTHPTCAAAKMSAEQYVRDQTGGAA